MIVKRFFEPSIAQSSYLIGCAQTGEAVVIDPNRDVEQYINEAAREGLRITHVTETHIHADFVSGSRELAQRTAPACYCPTKAIRTGSINTSTARTTINGCTVAIASSSAVSMWRCCTRRDIRRSISPS